MKPRRKIKENKCLSNSQGNNKHEADRNNKDDPGFQNRIQ